MDDIGLITEETADLPQKIVTENQIVIVPVILNWPEIEKLPGENTFQKMRELERRGIKSFGKTSQPSPRDFIDRFSFLLSKFNKVICITLTSRLSGSHNSAILAKQNLREEEQERIFIVDSQSASGGQAFVVLKAIDLIRAGKEIEEVIEGLIGFIPRIHLFAMFEDPKWPEASGRISRTVANLMRGMARLGIRPLLRFRNGVLVPVGLRTKAKEIPHVLYRQLEKETAKLRHEGKKVRIIITHGDNSAGVSRLRDMVEKNLSNTEVVFTNIINNVVGAPAGPDTIAVAWHEV